jgi:hypothetical protein
MSRWSRLIPGIGFAVLLAACGNAGSDTPMAPVTPRMDGGGVIVNGNAFGTGSGQTTTTQSTTASDPAPADSTGTGGATGGVIVNGN